MAQISPSLQFLKPSGVTQLQREPFTGELNTRGELAIFTEIAFYVANGMR